MKLYYSDENVLKPLKLEYEHDKKIKFKNEEFESDDGYQFIYSPILQKIKDQTSNSQTNFYLSSSVSMSSFLEDSKTIVQFASSISSPSGIYVADGFNPNRGNDWVTYYNSINSPDLNKTVDININQSLSGLRQNYLISSAYKTKIDNQIIEINFHGLKNIQTIQNEYTYAPVISGSLSILDLNVDNLKLREYDKIFSGTKQDGGYDNLHLGYMTEFAKPVYFEPDKTTYFHYPETAPRIPLSSIGIEYIGSTYGTTPNRSDRIYKKMANYKKRIWWGNSRQWQTGVWLCSWLSGSPDGISAPIWMDRWYLPGTTLRNALTSFVIDYDYITYNTHDPIIWDEPTQMTFDPGVWYKYIHMGDENNQYIVDTLAGNDNINLKLHYNDWLDVHVIDESIYNNNATIKPLFNIDIDRSLLDLDANITDDYALNLHGNNEALTPYSNSYTPSANHSVNFWIYAEDWNNAKSAPFVGNYFRGGWKIGYTNNFNNPLLYMIDSTYGHIIPYTIHDHIMHDIIAPTDGGEFATIEAIAVDTKHYLYTLDSNKNALYKIDYDGNILNQVIFNSMDLINHIEIIPHNDMELICVASTTNSCSAFESTCLNQISAFTGTGNISSFTFDLSSNYIYDNAATKIVIDNNNSQWKLTPTQLLKNDVVIVDDIFNDINCDRDNIIWAITELGVLTQFDNNGNKLLSTQIDNLSSIRNIQFTYEWVGTPSHICEFIEGVSTNSYHTFAYISNKDQSRIYKINTSGDIVKTIYPTNYINLTKYNHNKRNMKFCIPGDFSSYDYYRKYWFNRNNQKPQIYVQYDYFKEGDIVPKTKQLFFSAQDFPSTWHQIGFTFDCENSKVNLYIDAKLYLQINHEPETKIYSKYTSPLVIGRNSGLLNSLDDEFKIRDYGFDGKIADIRIYDNIINSSDLRHIYLTKFKFVTLTWAMPTGKQNIIEEIERFFKQKLPGLKSHFYNIKIQGLDIINKETKDIIEQIIRDTSKKVSPAYTELYQIVWG